MRYFRGRFGELSWWVGCLVMLLCLGAFWYWRHEVFALVSAGVSGAVAVVPDGVLRRLLRDELGEVRFPRDELGELAALLRGAAAGRDRVEDGMSVLSDIVSEVEKAAVVAVEGYIANSPLGVEEKAAAEAIMAAFKAPSVSGALVAMEDVFRVLSDLKGQVSAQANTIERLSSPVATPPV